ncbi:MAG: glycogen synthase [Bacilli bacterium]|jgi:starch synthase
MRILMVTSESNPFVKTGGLADVVYALSKEEVLLSHEVSIVLPLYKLIKEKHNYPLREMVRLNITLSWRNQEAVIYQTFVDGITFYFIGNDYYFNRDGVYGHSDDTERFAFFSRAVLSLLKYLKKPFDIIHLHDWQPGMLPVLIKENEKGNRLFSKTKFVLTIHNPAFQGMFEPGLLPDLFEIDYRLFLDGTVRFDYAASSLKAAIIYADKITTVSPTHAKELLTPEGSKGLDAIIQYRKGDFIGILNGVDYGEFNPETDPHIARNFTIRNFITGKKACKKDLLLRLHLKKDVKPPMFGLVSRLTWQKGLELAIAGFENLLKRGAYVVVLGSGEPIYEQALQSLRDRYPKQMGIYIGYSDELAHKIYAGCDFFVMPSLFEPCGIGQMLAQRYGTLPIVRQTGGLCDSVIIYNGENLDQANGFGFDAFSSEWMIRTLEFAYEIYHDRELFRRLIRNALKTNNTWRKSAKKYLEVYQLALRG